MDSVRYEHGDFFRFLKRFKTIKMSNYTHTSMSNPAGSFFIPPDQQDQFFRLYKQALKSGEDLYLTERHAEISPVLIDIDLRFTNDGNLNHRYTTDQIETILKTYTKALTEYVEFSKATAYVMEKKRGSLDSKTNLIKDGLHIVIADVVTRPGVQYIVRKKVLETLERLVFQPMKATNMVEDIVDERVIELNNWQMYGSKKPEGEPYKITRIYQAEVEDQEISLTQLPKNKSEDQYVEVVAISNKSRETRVKFDKMEEIDTFELNMFEERERHKRVVIATQQSRNNKKNETPYHDLVVGLVRILNPARSNNYDDWIRVGWCLRNIDYRLMNEWIEFSKHSPKFVDGECEKVWDYMRENGLGIGTLKMWARTDNPAEYERIVSSDLFELIKSSMSKTHYDISLVIHQMYQHEFVCISTKNKAWYQFKDHRWTPVDGGYSLRMKISDDVVRQYTKAVSHYNELASTAGGDEQSIYLAKVQTLNKIALQLKTTSFKEALMKECADRFYDPKFEEKLDSNTNLIGFNDGILDLDTMEFRAGLPEDYVSFTTGINYKAFDESDPHYAGIMDFITKVLPDEDVRDYVLKILASILNGQVRDEKFYIWTGTGGNGKSKLLELLLLTLGDYYYNMNVTAITGKRVASNATNSELVQSKGKRVVVLQEPSENEKLNIGYMKELSGGDRISARGLFKEPIQFKPQFKLILACNALPEVPGNDGGTWRRIRVTNFNSVFCDNPDPEKSNEFLIDRDLNKKFDAWKESFMALLVEYYKKYRDEGITEPESVMEGTKKYQYENDILSEYFEERVEKCETAHVKLRDICEDMKAWVKENNYSYDKNPKRKDIQTHMERVMGKPVKIAGCLCWKGYRCRANVEYAEDHVDGF
jgi:P4 family phage/plasmid primase-like protien